MEITHIAASISIATAALGAAGAPAMAAISTAPSTAQASTIATGDRVTGQVELWGRSSASIFGAVPSESAGSGLVVLADLSGAGSWELPALGKTGPTSPVSVSTRICV